MSIISCLPDVILKKEISCAVHSFDNNSSGDKSACKKGNIAVTPKSSKREPMIVIMHTQITSLFCLILRILFNCLIIRYKPLTLFILIPLLCEAPIFSITYRNNHTIHSVSNIIEYSPFSTYPKNFSSSIRHQQ